MPDPTSPDGDNADLGAPTPTTPPPSPPANSLTPDEVDKVLARQRAQSAREATKALLEDLGIDKVENLKALVTRVRDEDKAKMTEAERLASEAKEARDAAVADRQAAALERHSLKVERALTAASAQGDLSKLARLVDVEPGADDAAINAAVDGLKASFSALFGAPQRGTPSPSEPAGGGQPTRTPTGTDPLALGAERAKQYQEGRRTFS